MKKNVGNRNAVVVIALLLFSALNIAYAAPTIHETWQSEWDKLDQQSEDQIVADIVDCINSKSKAPFMLGAATAEYQILGQNSLGSSQMAHGEKHMIHDKSGSACGGWEQHSKDIELLEKCGLNAYRFSIDWSAIQPTQDSWDTAKLQHYIDFCKELRSRNIKVMVTLHHFVHPQWFEELGAFEHSDNNKHLVRFCRKVFAELAPYVDQFCTINEPGIYVFQSYIRGVFPPFKSVTFPYLPSLGLRESWSPRENAGYGNIKLAGQVLLNLLNAHVAIYQSCQEVWTEKTKFLAEKKDSGLRLSEKNEDWLAMTTCPPIGFVHQYLTFRNFHKTYQCIPYQSACAGALLAGAAFLATQNNENEIQRYGKLPMYGMLSTAAVLTTGMVGRIEETVANILNNWIHWSVMNFFEHGEFNFAGASHLKQTIPAAQDSFDFVGLNYYSVVSFNLAQLNPGPDYYDNDIRTDMPYGIYAEGLYRAIERMAQLGKPIYITENGIADEKDIARNTWIKRHFWAISKAINNGYDVRGFYYWSLMDNWEWDMSYGPKFGLYKVDFASPNLKRTLRDGSKIYQKIGLALNQGL